MMDQIDKVELVTNIFGRWQSFHDAEVHRVLLVRDFERGPSLEVMVHVFHVAKEVDLNGYFVQSDHALVTPSFTGVDFGCLANVYDQNVLWNIPSPSSTQVCPLAAASPFASPPHTGWMPSSRVCDVLSRRLDRYHAESGG